MSFGLIDNISEMLFQVFGTGLIMAAFMILFILILMLVLRFPIGAMLTILVPLILGMVLIPSIMAIPAWIYVSVLMFVGLVLAGFYFFLFRG